MLLHRESAEASPMTLSLDTSYNPLASTSLQDVAITPVRKECFASGNSEDL